jgi:hypothetical protein
MRAKKVPHFLHFHLIFLTPLIPSSHSQLLTFQIKQGTISILQLHTQLFNTRVLN